MTRCWKWVKDHPWALLVAFASVLGALALWKSSGNKVASLNDAIQVRAAAREIAAKEGRADLLAEQADARGSDVSALHREVAASKRRVMEIHAAEPLDGRSDAEVAALFTEAGF